MGTMEGREEDARSPVAAAAGEEKIFVSVRLRPLNEKEILRRDVSDWECITDTTIIYKNPNISVSERSMYPTAYTFDRVFRTDCSTRQVYEEGAKEVALSVVSGINSTVFAYGQTSSGKTYTMTGITEYTIADICEYIQKHKEREFVVKFSAMEIYNECVRDLLSTDSTPLRLLDDPERGTTVERLTEEVLRDWNHVIELLSVCEAQRQNGETALNETSSRSHQIIRLTIESSTREYLGKDNSSTLTATVNFVDLAGSERASQSLSAGTRLKEGCHINRSLLTLGTVIRKLSKGKNGHIPFRDSKLTRILQSSLGGNARTAIICTMSPARSHVEQSRNTLLFASCAKEVITNAQVNVVMSDKALVKHLQRELARLESELRSPGSSFQDYTAVLLQKDHQIERLEKEIKDLILQRDIAQSQVKDLLRLLGDDGSSMIQVDLGHYPNLRVHGSPDSQARVPDTASLVDSPSFSAHSRSSSDDNFIRVPDFADNSQLNTPSPRLLANSSNSIESESYQAWEYIEKRSSVTSEDMCKDVRCIETEESQSYKQPEELQSDTLSPICYGDGKTPESLLVPLEKERRSASPSLQEEQDSVSLLLKEHEEQVSPPIKEEKELLSTSLNEEKELHCVNSYDISEKSFPSQDLTEDASESRILKLSKSSSCSARLMTMQSSPLFDKIENDENTPPNGFEREFVARPEGFDIKPSALKFDSVVERLSSEEYNPSAGGSAATGIQAKTVVERLSSEEYNPSAGDSAATGIQAKTVVERLSSEEYNPSAGDSAATGNQAKTVEPLGNDNVSSTAASTPERKELMELQQHNEIPDTLTDKDDQKAVQPRKSVKDVGLDPIEDEFKTLTNWPSEFKRIQREIVDLWDSCHVSLVHRTYFYLLFRGDSADAIYLEVELRRLTFLKDTFSRGETATVNGRSISLSSSTRGLRQERRMLSKQMLKKLTEQEREGLFLKWGISLNSKLRRLQLAHRPWTNTEDMNHIADSAYLVAKLVGFTESGQQTPKAMFGLNFTPRTASRNYSFKRSLISLL